MLAPPGYELCEPIHSGAHCTVIRAQRVPSRESVVLKVNTTSDTADSALARAEHELSVAVAIHSDHVVRYLGVEQYDEQVALIAEGFGDSSLQGLLERGPLPVGVGLRVGAQIAAGLSAIHDQGVTHCAIHPGNVVIDTGSWTAKLIDFAAASVLPERAETSPLDVGVMPLPYVSPEQTGWMNRKIDYRTDLYSLGATLYHAFAGCPPFDDADPLALAHAHLARPHRPLASIDASIPVPVSDIVDRLLAKSPEDRYQSARGVGADLEECARQYIPSGSIAHFALGRADIPEKFVIPQKLYGRHAEYAQLLDAYADVVDGKKILFVVSGYAGTGKSSLVHELKGPVLERRGLFASGKFDPLARHAPFSALVRALTRLCRYLLGLPEDELSLWRERLQRVLSSNAGLMVDIVPALQQILGTQPPVPPAGLIESEHRFVLTLARLLGVFAGEAHPLVLFLDDLQWADPATLRVLAALLRMPEPSHLLVIGAYRDNEVGEDHPLAIALDDLARSGATELRRVALGDLTSDDLTLLVADTVRRRPAEVSELSRLVAEKTSGNPFFAAEFLRALHEERHLRISREEHAWSWDQKQIAALGLAPNVVDLVLRKLHRLPKPTLELVQFAAAAGNRFDLGLLAAAAEVTPAAARTRLAPAIRERLLVPLDPGYPMGLADVTAPAVDRDDYAFRFLHDRVQQAAYASLVATAGPAVHLRLGRILAQHARSDDRIELFDVVDQLNRGVELMTDGEERLDLARLNFTVGDRARRRTAYHEARAYLERGIALLPPDAWSREYELTASLHLDYAECTYLSGRLDEAIAFSAALLPKLRTTSEKAELYVTRIAVKAARGQFGHALRLSREALDMLGHPAPSNDMAAVLDARERVLHALRGRRIEELARLPELTDPRLHAVVKILMHSHVAAYFGDPTYLFSWITHEQIRIAIEHGVSAESACAFSNYGMYLIARERDYEGALAFGQLALTLSERPDAFALRCQVYESVAVTSHAYAVNHLRTCIPLLKRAIELGLESGSLLYVSLGTAVLPDMLFMVGEHLDEVCREAELRERSIRAFRQQEMTLSLKVFLQSMRCLRGETRARLSLTTDDVDEAALVAEAEASPARLATTIHAMYQVILRALLGDWENAARTVLAADVAIEIANTALVRLTEYGFFACLALSEARRLPQLNQRAVRLLLGEKRRLLARWARSAPVNCRHTYLLVTAELAEARGRHGLATRLYDEAIRDALAHGFQQHAALASELAGRAYERRGLAQIARVFRQAARDGYAKWGALGKVRAMDEDYPDLAPRSLTAARQPLDALGVIRASQALSSEIDVDALVERVLRVIVQASGAQRGSLLGEVEGRLELQAHLDLEQGVLLMRPAPEASPKPYAEGIVRYTHRTGEDVVLSHAAHTGDFTRDPHVLANASKSILCMAVRHRDRVMGVMFLENTLVTDVFTPDRLDVLRVLVAQAAISLQNARLYDATRRLNLDLRAREELLREFLEGMPVGVYVVDAGGRLAFTNRAAGSILGSSAHRAHDAVKPPLFLDPHVAGTEQPYPTARLPLARALRGETSMIDDMELRLPERTISLAVWGRPILDDDGAVRHAVIAFQDISALRAAEAARAALEEQLHHAERLESIGRLAGGVAHDFNNLLTPILVYSDLAVQALPADSPVREEVMQIRAAAGHAAELTKQLLAFGRRQVLDTRVVNLNQELRSFEPMLRRLLRENIALELRLGRALGNVRADPSQIQRMVMNVAMNAADAMPQGGRLRIETENVRRVTHSPSGEPEPPSGPCVVLRVSDTGCGMDKQTLAKIFDPFFTTKGPGEGTGLGLPTVYGLVQQHGGTLDVRSARGVGTTVDIILPRVFEEDAPSSSRRPPALQAPDHLILVVEDEPAVRTVVQRLLKRAGYRVLSAADPTEALTIADACARPIDLLVTDVVMPIMNGRELFTELSRSQPSLSVLFMSGYPGDVLSDNGLLDSGIELLQKPLSAETLLGKVREILARRAQAQPSH